MKVPICRIDPADLFQRLRARPDVSGELVSFSDLRTAAYCPRKLYYRRGEDADQSPPQRVDEIRALERRYETLLGAPAGALEDERIAVSPVTYRESLAATRDRLTAAGEWERLRNPETRDVLVTGRDCRGVVHKVLADPLEPVLIATGRPPDRGVWASQSVHAVAAAKALAWSHETGVDRAWLEYPAHGVVRSVPLTLHRTQRYRATLETARDCDGPPPRTQNRSKCESCEYADQCGVRTRTLRSLLGFGSE